MESILVDHHEAGQSKRIYELDSPNYSSKDSEDNKSIVDYPKISPLVRNSGSITTGSIIDILEADADKFKGLFGIENAPEPIPMVLADLNEFNKESQDSESISMSFEDSNEFDKVSQDFESISDFLANSFEFNKESQDCPKDSRMDIVKIKIDYEIEYSNNIKDLKASILNNGIDMDDLKNDEGNHSSFKIESVEKVNIERIQCIPNLKDLEINISKNEIDINDCNNLEENHPSFKTECREQVHNEKSQFNQNIKIQEDNQIAKKESKTSSRINKNHSKSKTESNKIKEESKNKAKTKLKTDDKVKNLENKTKIDINNYDETKIDIFEYNETNHKLIKIGSKVCLIEKKSKKKPKTILKNGDDDEESKKESAAESMIKKNDAKYKEESNIEANENVKKSKKKPKTILKNGDHDEESKKESGEGSMIKKNDETSKEESNIEANENGKKSKKKKKIILKNGDHDEESKKESGEGSMIKKNDTKSREESNIEANENGEKSKKRSNRLIKPVGNRSKQKQKTSRYTHLQNLTKKVFRKIIKISKIINGEFYLRKMSIKMKFLEKYLPKYRKNIIKIRKCLKSLEDFYEKSKRVIELGDCIIPEVYTASKIYLYYSELSNDQNCDTAIKNNENPENSEIEPKNKDRPISNDDKNESRDLMIIDKFQDQGEIVEAELQLNIKRERNKLTDSPVEPTKKIKTDNNAEDGLTSAQKEAIVKKKRRDIYRKISDIALIPKNYVREENTKFEIQVKLDEYFNIESKFLKKKEEFNLEDFICNGKFFIDEKVSKILMYIATLKMTDLNESKNNAHYVSKDLIEKIKLIIEANKNIFPPWTKIEKSNFLKSIPNAVLILLVFIFFTKISEKDISLIYLHIVNQAHRFYFPNFDSKVLKYCFMKPLNLFFYYLLTDLIYHKNSVFDFFRLDINILGDIYSESEQYKTIDCHVKEYKFIESCKKSEAKFTFLFLINQIFNEEKLNFIIKNFKYHPKLDQKSISNKIPTLDDIISKGVSIEKIFKRMILKQKFIEFLG